MNKKEDINKEALWLTYGKKCAYTGADLELNNVTKDHIIPVSVFQPKGKDREEAQTALRKKYDLPDDFNFNGLANIVPTSEYQNRNMKNNAIFEESAIRYFVNIATSKASSYKENLEALNSRDKVAELLELLKVFEGDMEQLLNYDKGIFDLDFTLFFADEDVSVVNKDKIDEMLNKIIFPEGVELVKYTSSSLFAKPSSKKIVKSCNEYMHAAREGYFADNNWGMKFSCRLATQYNILNALNHAKPVTNSHIKDYGVFSLCNIPSSFFPIVGEEDYGGYKSYVDAINQGVFKLDTISKKILSVSCEGMNHYFVEVFRADFNGDGYEEILVYSHGSIDNASYSYGGSYFITMDKDTNMFERIDIDWD